MSDKVDRFAADVLNLALQGGTIQRGQVFFLAERQGLVVDAGHDGLGGTSYHLTDAGRDLKKRSEQAEAREKILELQDEIRKLEATANG